MTAVVCRNAADRTAETWKKQLEPFSSLEFAVSDAAKGIAAAVEQVAAGRHGGADAGPTLEHGLDVFHTTREARRALARHWRRAEAAREHAEDADAKVAAAKRQGVDARGAAGGERALLLRHRAALLGDHELLERAAAQVLLAVAERALEGGVGLEDQPLQVHQQDGELGALEDGAEVLGAFAEDVRAVGVAHVLDRSLDVEDAAVGAAVRARGVADQHAAAVHFLEARLEAARDAVAVEHLAEAAAVVEREARELARTIDEIAGHGAEVKDIDDGLIDFPALRGGETVLLCWRLGEDEIAYWHTVEDGFAGRRPLPL